MNSESLNYYIPLDEGQPKLEKAGDNQIRNDIFK